MATRLEKNILKLMKEDEEFCYAVAGLLGLEEILNVSTSTKQNW